MWYSRRAAESLFRAVAARSGADLCLGVTFVATTTTAAVLVSSETGADNNDKNNNENDDGCRNDYCENNNNDEGILWPRLSLLSTTGSSSAATRRRYFPLNNNNHNNNGGSMTTTTITSCEGIFDFNNNPSRSISKLRRTETMRRMAATREKATLESKYDVEEKPIGEGTYGALYVGTNRKTGEAVAVKKIDKAYTDTAMFQREMDALMHIRSNGGHPHICGLHENFEERGHYFLILDMIKGLDMFDHLIDKGAYSEADAARLIREVGSSLAFMHGIGIVHGDLKPENLMLSSRNPLNAVIKIVDMGCAQVREEEGILPNRSAVATTVAYTPPEVLLADPHTPIEPSFDMWSLGIIVYVMLTGVHPYDIHNDASDEEVSDRILTKKQLPLKKHPITAGLSESAIDLIDRLTQRDPSRRLTAAEMLDHPWVRGETSSTEKIAHSDKRLSMFQDYKPDLEAKVFADMVGWSDRTSGDVDAKKKNLFQHSFHGLDSKKRGYVTKSDLRRLSTVNNNSPNSTRQQQQKRNKVTLSARESLGGKDEQQISLSDFTDLLAGNMKNRYFPKGHIVYREGDSGDAMYFINSGTVEAVCRDGHISVRTQGDSFGSGALLNPNNRVRMSMVRCTTPVHAIEISKDFFDKYRDTDDSILTILNMKGKLRKQERTKRLLASHTQKNTADRTVPKNEYVYREGDTDDKLYILEDGKADVFVKDHFVFSMLPGEFTGVSAVMNQKPTNTSAKCVTDKCAFRVMDGTDFRQLIKSNPWWFKESMQDINNRREFQKAVVLGRRSSFPTERNKLREVFREVDTKGKGSLQLDDIRQLLLQFDPTMKEEEIQNILKSLDLNNDNTIDWDEFRHLFGGDGDGNETSSGK